MMATGTAGADPRSSGSTAPGSGRGSQRQAGKRPPEYTIPIVNWFLRTFCFCCTPPSYQLTLRAPANCEMCLMHCVDIFVYLLGPVLICLASAIIVGLSYAFFTVLLPMLSASEQLAANASAATEKSTPTTIIYTPYIVSQIAFVAFLLINIIHNYVLCVSTRNNGKNFDRLVRELAEATGFVYPETEQERLDCRKDYQDKLMARSKARRDMARRRMQEHRQQQQIQNGVAMAGSAGNGSSVAVSSGAADGTSPQQQPTPLQQATMPGWMLMDPLEWGYCLKSDQPKPPRSHYDHVTSSLVLNMDHYCPWVFNTIGYFNYRYFCNFLFYVWFSMMYGATMTFRPFRNMNNALFRQQVKLSKEAGFKTAQHMLRLVPTPNERTPITFAFMLTLSIGLAITILGGFHLYLLLTAQTTIEFHGNWAKRKGAAKRGTRWKNPYSLGWKSNWKLVYGSGNPLLAMLPSSREPEYFPIPINGRLVRRHSQSKKEEGLPLVAPTRKENASSDVFAESALDGALNKRRGGVHEV